MNTESSKPDFYWYTLRVFRDESKCISQIKEHISMGKLQDKIVDICFFKEYEIVESDDYSPNSDLLPKRGFKSTKNGAWVRLKNGNYRRIKIVEKKVFGGMIFLKMDYDMDLFKLVRSWDSGFSFLGFPSPSAMSDYQIKKTAESLNSEVPDLMEYISSKGYTLAKQGEEIIAERIHIKENEVSKESKEPISIAEKTLSEEEKMAVKKAEIYSDLKIKEYDISDQNIKKKDKSKLDDRLKANDFVFVNHLGLQGVIQEIDYDNNRVSVSVRMFGRRQPIECKISDVSIKIPRDSDGLS